MKSLFNNTHYQEILDRIEKLSPDTEAKWGKMSVSQMLHHCQAPLKIALEKQEVEPPGWIQKTVAKLFKSKLYNDSPWQKSLPTLPEFKVREEKDFEHEKFLLLQNITDFHHRKDKEEWPPHPVFGHFNKEQWGKMQYKHLDHHLTQFGV
ncbi:DUF1569 domain-containing protein [Robertkochia aurantiaca]|uniref:DUF1569 domain-containing protein n=1 Tax=Robertkochia aurantiaca TaxID=2873700 RepID=UPI001CCDD91E